jgi:hypothetical protein
MRDDLLAFGKIVAFLLGAWLCLLLAIAFVGALIGFVIGAF